MSGRGRVRRIITNNGAKSNGGLSLNDRFSQLRDTTTSSRPARREANFARGSNSRFSSQMEKRTGRKFPLGQGVNKTRRGGGGQTSFQTRRVTRGGGGGGVVGNTRFRGNAGGRGGRGGRGRGAGRGRGGRGGGHGRGRKENLSQDDLDADLDNYMGRSEKVASAKLDEDLEAYMAERAESNSEEKKA